MIAINLQLVQFHQQVRRALSLLVRPSGQQLLFHLGNLFLPVCNSNIQHIETKNKKHSENANTSTSMTFKDSKKIFK